MNILFLAPGDFPVNYSNRDTSWNAWNRHSWSFMADTEIIFSKLWGLPLTNVKWHSDPWPVTSDFPTDQTSHQFHDSDTELDLHWITSGFHGAFATGCVMPTGNAYPFGHLVPSPFWGLTCTQIVETSLSELAVSFLDFSPWINPLGAFLHFDLKWRLEMIRSNANFVSQSESLKRTPRA